MSGTPRAADRTSAPSAPLYSAAMTSPPLVLTPRQAADRLGVGLPTLRRHAATWETLAGEELPRGEHLERLWPEPVVEMLGQALAAVHRREAPSVAEALGALYLPHTPSPVPLPDSGEALRVLIREEVRAVIREELRAGVVAALPGDELRDVVRYELRQALDADRVRVLTHSTAPALPSRRGLLARLWAALKG